MKIIHYLLELLSVDEQRIAIEKTHGLEYTFFNNEEGYIALSNTSQKNAACSNEKEECN